VQSSDVKSLEDNEQLFTYPLADDLYVKGGAINNGGIVLKWLSELFLPGQGSEKNNYEVLLSAAESSAAGANGLLFLPYLLGERAPVWDPEAKGVLFGLSIKHRRQDIVRAALEGICFTLYQIVRKLEKVYGTVNEIYVSGGFIRSSFWVQLIADISGKKLRITEAADASAIGAAYLGMYATGFLKRLSEIKKFTRFGKIYEPVLKVHKEYDSLFQLFDSLYPKLKDDFAAVSRL
jgi:gluconokinase